MPLLDPLSIFSNNLSLSDAELSQGYRDAPVDFPVGIPITGEVNRRANQGFFGGLFDSGKDFLGFATDGLQFIEQFDAGVERVFGEGFLPDDTPPPALRASLGASVAGIPIVFLVIGGGAAIWLAAR